MLIGATAVNFQIAWREALPGTALTRNSRIVAGDGGVGGAATAVLVGTLRPHWGAGEIVQNIGIGGEGHLYPGIEGGPVVDAGGGVGLGPARLVVPHTDRTNWNVRHRGLRMVDVDTKE